MGYDPVAYFTEHRAVKGTPDHAYSWLGATWHFANRTTRSSSPVTPPSTPLSMEDIAQGVAYGESTSNIDPQAWRIIDGKLYLNYSAGGSVEWEKGYTEHHVAAETKWPSIKARLEVEPSRE